MTGAEVAAVSKLPRTALLTRWRALFDSDPAPRLGNRTMVRIIVSELQWRESGQTLARYARRLQKVAAHTSNTKPHAGSGTRLVREWNGRRHVVDVTPEGYVWNGRTWRSLSAIAREITGARWSGPRFFGVSG